MAVTNYDYSQTRIGWVGATSESKDSTRLYGRSENRTFWSGKITGTDATIRATSDFGANAGLIQVSVDGGAFGAASNVSTIYTLFAGLSDVEHDVLIKIGTGFGGAGYTFNDGGTVIEVTGAVPALAVLDYPYSLHDPSQVTAGEYEDNLVDYIPLQLFIENNPLYTARVRFRSSATAMKIITIGGEDVYISIDGGNSFTVTPETNGIAEYSPDGDAHDFNVFCLNNIIAVITDSEKLTSGARMDQYGDSITEGANNVEGEPVVDTNNVAAFFGRLGSGYAVGGWSINDLLTNLPSIIASTNVNFNDVAVVAIGRNDAGAIGSTEEFEYKQIIDLLIARGYAKILCRGILPEGAELWPTENAALESVVVAVDNPKVVWVDTSAWSGIDTSDGVHPSVAGYLQIQAYAEVDYAPFMPSTSEGSTIIIGDTQMSELTIGGTSQFVTVSITDTNGDPLTGLAFDDAGLAASYVRDGVTAAVDITLATMVLNTWASGGFVEIDSIKQPGDYQLGVPDALAVAGASSAKIIMLGAATMRQANHPVNLAAKGSDDRSLVSADAHTSGQTIAANASINTTGGSIDSVALVATTTTNADMRGTDNAATAASLAAQNNFDPATEAVANVTLVATTTTNTDMRGTDSANTLAPDNAGITQIQADIATLSAKSSTLAIPKNSIYSDFPVLMLLTADNQPATGLTVAGERSIDGGAFEAVTGTITEVSDGYYSFDSSAADTNGNSIVWLFKGDDANNAGIAFQTVR